VNVSSALLKVVELGDKDELTVEFTYSVKWASTDIPFERRNYLSSQFFNSEMEIHWLSIVNSIVLVILLTGFLAIIIMRVLKSDYTRYNNDEEQDGILSLSLFSLSLSLSLSLSFFLSLWH